MNIINLQDINKIYGKNDTLFYALKNVSLQIYQGEMVAIMGPSGSGKSTLLNIIGLLDKQSTGKYFLNGEDVYNFADSHLSRLRNKYFGFVVQNYALIHDYTVFENIEIPISYSKNKANKKERILELLSKLGLGNKIKSKCKELSGGQSQRVAIARALVNDPAVILADEPTGALDQKNGKEVLDILKNINEMGKTVIIVTHDIAVSNLCHKVINIIDGETVINANHKRTDTL